MIVTPAAGCAPNGITGPYGAGHRGDGVKRLLTMFSARDRFNMLALTVGGAQHWSQPERGVRRSAKGT